MASADRYPVRHGEPEMDILGGRITGAGAAVPTVTEGCNGFTITRAGVGLYDITFASGPNIVYVWPTTPGKWATTLTDFDGWDTVWGAYNATTRTIRLSVVTQAQALADLPAATGLSLAFFVKKTSTRG